MNINEYLRNTREVHPNRLWEKFDKDWPSLADIFHKKGYQLFNNKILTRPENKSWYYEVCYTPYKRGNYVRKDQLFEHWEKIKIKDVHNSMFAHDEKWVENYKETGSVSCENTLVHGPILWLEIDRKLPSGETDLQKAVKDGLKIKNNFIRTVKSRYEDAPNDSIAWLFSSGNSSTHLLINMSLFGNPITDQKYCGRRKVWYNLAHKIAGAVRHGWAVDVHSLSKKKISEGFKKVWGKNPTKYDRDIIYQSMENIDPSVYGVNSLIRQPWSKHEKGKSKKVLVDNRGNFIYDYTPINYIDHPPVLMDWWWECWRETKKQKSLDNKYKSSYIVEEYSQVFEDLPLMKPNAKGFVGPFHNPFYTDTKPDVWVNLETGLMKDFGSYEYTMSFNEFLLKKREEL